MEEVREYRTAIRGDSLANLAAAIDEMLKAGAPPVSKFSIDNPRPGEYRRRLVARYTPESCWVRDCGQPAIREEEDILICAAHTVADVTGWSGGRRPAYAHRSMKKPQR